DRLSLARVDRASAIAGNRGGAAGVRLESDRHGHEGRGHRARARRARRDRHVDARLAVDRSRGGPQGVGSVASMTIGTAELNGVFAVPPLPRRRDTRRTLDIDAAEAVARHIEEGGITRFLYGGNAFLYHATLGEFEMLAGWLASFDAPRVPIPSIGPSFGHALDQARILRRHRFPAAMLLPCGDPRDARGLEAGYREIADAAGMPLVLYLKSEDAMGSHTDAGLDAVGRLVDSGVAVAIKYAVVLDDPSRDPYLDGLLARVDRSLVFTGMG